MPVNSPSLPSLCSNTAQVPHLNYNQINVKDLQREVIFDVLNEMGFEDVAYAVKECGRTFMHLQDKNGHEKYSRMHCKNEFCPSCGEKGSQVHKRRVVRAMDRLIWADILGYMVFTLPKEVSAARPDKKDLYYLSKKAWEVVKENFKAPGGLVRTHLMGEEPENLHIHINVLFPILSPDGLGRVSQETLDSVRRKWTQIINGFFELTYESTNVYYKFALVDGKKKHKIKYVLRPIVTSEKFLTLSDEDRRYVLSLKGWHNSRWYGSLANSQYKKFLGSMGIDSSKIESKEVMSVSKKCPVCGEPYKYLGVVCESDIPKNQGRWLDKNTFIDLETFAYLKEKIPKESEVLSVGYPK